MPPQEPEPLERALPREVVTLGLDPAVALLVTLYVLYIGQTIGEELAAATGFPVFPADHEKRLGLMHDLGRYLDPQWAIGLIEELEDNLTASPQGDVPEAARERLLAAAILNQGERTQQQSEELSGTLSKVSVDSAHDREDLRAWNPGLRAVSRITRLMIKATLPAQIRTMHNLSDPDSGLRVIATLGGALFLGHGIGVLTSKDSGIPQSRYAALGGRIALLTDKSGGQLVKVPSAEVADQYAADLARFAKSGDSVFAIEHPFHFRVLLEVLSDENRRYPAEPVLNVAALRRILRGDSFWPHVVWSRDQLPVVVNLLQHPEKPRADAFIQHYAAFGRTPHTSSFTHLGYEVSSPVGDDAVAASWPTAFQRYRGTDLQNMPNSVVQVNRAIDRQRSFGRLWRGAPEESDLRWLCGQLVDWDGYREPDAALADRVWHSDRWTGQTFPVAVMTEIRVGAWLLEALRLRLATAVTPVVQDEAESYQGQGNPDPEVKAIEELRCVLEIMALFSADYLSGEGDDGIPGLKNSLRRLRGNDWFTELGPKTSEKLDYLEASLETLGKQLDAEVRMAREALAGPDPQ